MACAVCLACHRGTPKPTPSARGKWWQHRSGTPLDACLCHPTFRKSQSVCAQPGTTQGPGTQQSAR
eukprot:6639365-Alexandrium_andersonii.AAC.1